MKKQWFSTTCLPDQSTWITGSITATFRFCPLSLSKLHTTKLLPPLSYDTKKNENAIFTLFTPHSVENLGVLSSKRGHGGKKKQSWFSRAISTVIGQKTQKWRACKQRFPRKKTRKPYALKTTMIHICINCG